MTNFKVWAKAACIRALKTAAETALGFVTIGNAIADVNWIQAASVTAVAALASLLWSIRGLPEVE